MWVLFLAGFCLSSGLGLSMETLYLKGIDPLYLGVTTRIGSFAVLIITMRGLLEMDRKSEHKPSLTDAQ